MGIPRRDARIVATRRAGETQGSGEAPDGPNQALGTSEATQAARLSQSRGVSAAAAAQGPPKEVSEAELAARLRLAVGRLSRKIRQQVAGEVTQSQVSVLNSVERLGAPTLGELASYEQVQPPSMTRQVDALEAGGLLARNVDPADRRIARVELTSAGRKFLQRNRSLRNAYLVQRLTRLSREERDRLGELVELLEHLADLA